MKHKPPRQIFDQPDKAHPSNILQNQIKYPSPPLL